MKDETEENLFVGLMVGDMTNHIRGYIDYVTEVNKEHPMGAYYFGLLACPCYLESILEDFTSLKCKAESKKEENIYSRIMNKIEKDVSRATGLDAWKTWMKILFDINLTEVLKEDWKTLTILFKLRNQLAHGRTTKFSHFFRSDGRFMGMSTSGSSYEEPLEYLLQKNIISLKEGEVPSADIFFTAEVVRYFFHVIDCSIIKLQSCPGLSRLQHYTENNKEERTKQLGASSKSSRDIIKEVEAPDGTSDEG